MIRDDILSAVFDDRSNVLIHGMAGTGKTYLLNEILDVARRLGIKVYATATTGVAAVNLSRGSTFHSYAGIGTAWQDKESLLRKVKFSKKSRERILSTELLIIDEISMYGTELLAKVNYVMKGIRGLDKPFGGIQLVLSGDFLQLPPVKDDWLFKSPEWNDLKLVPFTLKECKRYQDTSLFEMLSRIRIGTPTKIDLAILKERANAYKDLERIKVDETAILPTILYSRKVDAESYNTDKLNELKTKEYKFVAVDKFVARTREYVDFAPHKEQLENAIPLEITLKVGAQVMLRWNVDVGSGLVNGSRGVVLDIRINGETEVVDVKFLNGTIYKVTRVTWVNESDEACCTRFQMPLILGFATTIHKSQGSTIDYAIVNIGHSIFAKGQAYVALSRVRGIGGMFISEFVPNTIRADREALEYVSSIEERTYTKRYIELCFE